jgi:ubiquinone/menaquinone biosynthesis C-methylase UbiE
MQRGQSIDGPVIAPAGTPHVRESRFGVWFLGTDTWARHVLTVAITDLERLIAHRRAAYPVIVDIGCGWGHSLKLLQERFHPSRLIGIDIEPEMVEAAAAQARKNRLSVELRCESGARLSLPDRSADLIFCHQTFHHLSEQERAIAEFHRVLKPEGLLLFAESTRAYIHSWIIRLLFRHDMGMQKSAPEYIDLIRRAGFEIDPDAISYPYLWWSRPDLGIPERLLRIPPPAIREETLVNLAAIRK